MPKYKISYSILQVTDVEISAPSAEEAVKQILEFSDDAQVTDVREHEPRIVSCEIDL